MLLMETPDYLTVQLDTNKLLLLNHIISGLHEVMENNSHIDDGNGCTCEDDGLNLSSAVSKYVTEPSYCWLRYLFLLWKSELPLLVSSVLLIIWLLCCCPSPVATVAVVLSIHLIVHQYPFSSDGEV